MSKKRNGKARRSKKGPARCERCGYVATTSVKGDGPPSWAHKVGDFTKFPDEFGHISVEEARACAIAAGIIDVEGNLMPEYQ